MPREKQSAGTKLLERFTHWLGSALRLHLVLAAQRPAASLDGGHPRGRAATALALASRDSFQDEDRLF